MLNFKFIVVYVAYIVNFGKPVLRQSQQCIASLVCLAKKEVFLNC